jgi:hypothetical protein
MRRASLGCIGLVLYGQQVLALECAAPPVTKPDHAICLARQYAQKRTPPSWELEYRVKDEGSSWLVHYVPKPNVGRPDAAVDLRIDKSSGQVTFVRGYR